MQVFEIICCISQLLKLHMLYVYIYIYMYISIVSSLCFFLHRYLNALVSHIHQYSACFSTTSDQGFQLHRLHCCWQTVRSWYCGTEIWWYHRQDGNTKHVAKEFRLSTYQPINWCNGGIFSSSSWTWVASLHFFSQQLLKSRVPELTVQGMSEGMVW